MRVTAACGVWTAVVAAAAFTGCCARDTPSGNEANGKPAGNRFAAALADDLERLAHRDALNRRELRTEQSTNAALGREEQQLSTSLREMRQRDQILGSSNEREAEAEQAQTSSFDKRLSAVHAAHRKHAANIKHQLKNCSAVKARLVGELDTIRAELSMANQRLSETEMHQNRTDKKWRHLVTDLAGSIDQDGDLLAQLQDQLKNDTLAFHQSEDTRRSQHLRAQRGSAAVVSNSKQIQATHDAEQQLDTRISNALESIAALHLAGEQSSFETAQLKLSYEAAASSRAALELHTGAAEHEWAKKAKQLVRTTAGVQAQLSAAENSTRKLEIESSNAMEILATDREQIAVFTNQTAQLKAGAVPACDKELQKLRESSESESLQMELHQARRAEKAIAEENKSLKAQVESLRRQVR